LPQPFGLASGGALKKALLLAVIGFPVLPIMIRGVVAPKTDPDSIAINRRLGETLPEILEQCL